MTRAKPSAATKRVKTKLPDAKMAKGSKLATSRPAAGVHGRRALAEESGKPMTVKMHAAKTRLSELVARVEAGEEVVILRGDVPVAKLVPVKPVIERVPDVWKGRFTLDDSFFDPLPEEELAAWEGR